MEGPSHGEGLWKPVPAGCFDVFKILVLRGRSSAAARCEELIGKEIGMFIDRREQFVWDTDLSKWSNAQVRAVTEFMLRQHYGDDVQAIEAAKRQALIDAGVVVIEAEMINQKRAQQHDGEAHNI